MILFHLFGGVRVLRDGMALGLGNKQQQLLAALMLFHNRPVSSDVLIDYLWREDLPSNPLNSLQDVVKRLRNALGDSGRQLIVTRGRDYSLSVDPDQLDLSIFDCFARAGLALAPAAPAAGRVLLSKALEISEGDLPDAEPGSRASNEIDETYRLRNSVAHSVQREPPTAEESGSSVPFEGRATGLAIRMPDIEPLTLADIVCEVIRFHGKIHGFTDGLLLASFSGAGAALRCGSEISARLAPADGLLGGAICSLSAGGGVPSSIPLLQIVSTASRRQILVTSTVKEAAVASGAAGLLLPYDDDFWQISYGPVQQPPSRPGAEKVPTVGREETIVALGELLNQHSLVTLRGPGGIGKTRIARELAGRLTRRFKDGIHFVDLAEADYHGGPLSLVVRTLGFVPERYRHPEKTLVDLLGQSERLLILDNCEEFTDEMSSLCEAIGEGCPSVTILTTGRSALGASKELVYDIGELDLLDAARLMVALAFSDDQDASPDPSDPMILQLCSQLDSVPLAIECAASMVRSMGLSGASAALASLPDGAVLPLLDAAHEGLGRHRSIELALNASYRTLREEEANLLERLSSLRGGFRTEDAVGVVADAGDPESVAEGLVLLREASLVKQTGEDRWRVLEPVRQFAATRLLRRGEHATQAARHARHFIALACEAEVGLRGREEKSWFLRLSDAYANLDKALSWAVASNDALGALNLTSSLWWYWAAQGMFVEGSRAVERSLALEGLVPEALRAKTLVAISHLAWWAGNPHRTETSLNEAMELISRIERSDPGLVALEAWAHTGLAAARFWGNGDYRVLAGHLEQGKDLFVSIGDLPGLGLNLSTHSGVAWQYGHDLLHLSKALESLEVFENAGHQTMIAHSKRVVGLATAALGDVNAGRPLIVEGLKLSQDLGDMGGLPLGFAFKGLMETWAGNVDAAMSAFRSSILANRRLGQVWPSLLTIAFGAERASLSNRHTDAIRLNEVVGSLNDMTSIRLPPHDLVRVGQALERSAGLLDPHEVEKVRAEGAEMSVPNAMLLALSVFEE